MATLNVTLPDPMKDWVERRTREGRFGNAGDYVRHLIRNDRERQTALAAFQTEITLGIESGPARPFDPGAFTARMRESQYRQFRTRPAS